MAKVYLVIVEHCNDGEVTFNVHPFSNNDKAIQFLNEELENKLKLPCYTQKEIEIVNEISAYMNVCVICNNDSYYTNIHIEEKEIL